MAKQEAGMRRANKGQWYAASILITILASLITMVLSIPDSNSILSTRPNVRNISTGDAYAIMQNSSNLVIIDVRTPHEYQNGRLDNSINLNYYSSEFFDRLKSLDKNSTYIVYCRRGIRGGLALEMMRALGFKNAYNIAGGLTMWAKEGKPMNGDVI